MSREEYDSGAGPTRVFQWAILIAILAVLLIVGYLIIDTIFRLREPVVNAPAAVGTGIQELLNPTPTIYADPVTVIRAVQNLSRLETAVYTVEKVVTAETGQGALGWLLGDKLLLVAQGHVTAGVDLSLATTARTSEDTVWLYVPCAEIFDASLDLDETYIYDRETGLIAEQNDDLVLQAQREAERQILLAAVEDGIMDLAQQNAETFLTGFLESLGFDSVIFVTGTPAPGQQCEGNINP